jgi:hypothetical protein
MYLAPFDTYKLHELREVDATRGEKVNSKTIFDIGMAFELDSCLFL